MSGRFFKKTNASGIVQKLCIKAVFERNLICEGDKVLIATSGGKDSTVLAWALASIRPALKINYELSALHISSDFCSCCQKPALSKRLAEWGIPFTDLFVPVIGRLKEGRKMNCYWCSTQRRTELLKYAVENGFNKIALGHHLDDIIETFFMNICDKAQILAMPIVLKYRKYPVSLIRPLAYLEERQVIACAEEQAILKMACTCPFGRNSKRRDMRGRIAEFVSTPGCSSRSGDTSDMGDAGSIKRRILQALSSPHDYLSE